MSRDFYEHEPERDVANTAAVPAPPREAVVTKSLPAPERPARDASEPREQDSGREDGRSDDRLREPVQHYRINQHEAETLREVGKFRVMSTADLERFIYQGDSQAMRQDMRSLCDQGLLAKQLIVDRGNRFAAVALTKKGRTLLRKDAQLASGQAIYSGVVKPREARHDAGIYRMYQAEVADIRARGGTVRRVVLDYELKQKVYAPLAKDRPRLKPEEYAKRQAEVAAANGLEVVNGKIPLPDLRIEYQTREGEMTKVDLELATSHYKASQVAEKASAGFVVYSEGGGSEPEDRDLISEILSL